MYSNKEDVAGTDQLVEVRTVGGRFTDFLRGYAGVGVVLSYLQFLLVYVSERTIPPNLVDVTTFLVFFFGLPIFLLIAVIPSLILLDITREHRIRFVRNFAEKMGITDFVKFSLEKIDLGVIGGNKAAIKIYEKIGFKTKKIKENAIKRGSKHYDAITMEIKN